VFYIYNFCHEYEVHITRNFGQLDYMEAYTFYYLLFTIYFLLFTFFYLLFFYLLFFYLLFFYLLFFYLLFFYLLFFYLLFFYLLYFTRLGHINFFQTAAVKSNLAFDAFVNTKNSKNPANCHKLYLPVQT